MRCPCSTRPLQHGPGCGTPESRSRAGRVGTPSASPDLQPMPVATAREVAARWRVPLDRPLVVVIGRTDPTKGIGHLIHAAGPLRDEVHVVIIAVPFDQDDPLIADYARRIAREGVRATLVTEYTRRHPRQQTTPRRTTRHRPPPMTTFVNHIKTGQTEAAR